MSYIESAPAFVAQGVASDAVVYSPRVVTMLIETGIGTGTAVTDSLVLMRIWKWNWILDSVGDRRRFAEDEEPLPWKHLTFEQLAAQLVLSKSRVRDAIRRLLKWGLLQNRVVGERDGGTTAFYLVTWPSSPDRRNPSVGPNAATPETESNPRTDGIRRSLIVRVGDTKAVDVQPSLQEAGASTPAVFDDQPERSELCRQLANAVEAHRETRPKVGTRWLQDMGLLLRRGPKGVEGAPPTPAAVTAMITAVFTILNEPDGKGFCWADQVRSPGALRDHWDQLALALRRAPSHRRRDDADIVSAVQALRDAGL